MTIGTTDDLFFGGRLKLLQPRRGHRFGGDAALLAAAARSCLETEYVVADLGAGVGAVGLALAALGASRVAMIEIDADLSALSADNARRNGLSDRAVAVNADVRDVGRSGGPPEVSPAAFSLVVMNPPFDDATRFRASPNPAKARAHADGGEVVADWIAAASRLLRAGGSLVMIHRPEALAPILAALDRSFGDVRLRPVHGAADRPAARVLVAARLGRRGPLAFLPPFVLHDADGSFTSEAEAAQRGAAAIALD